MVKESLKPSRFYLFKVREHQKTQKYRKEMVNTEKRKSQGDIFEQSQGKKGKAIKTAGPSRGLRRFFPREWGTIQMLGILQAPKFPCRICKNLSKSEESSDIIGRKRTEVFALWSGTDT